MRGFSALQKGRQTSQKIWKDLQFINIFFQHPNALLPQSKTCRRKTLYMLKCPQKLNQFKYMTVIWAHTDVSWWITPWRRFDVTDQTHSPITGTFWKPWHSHGNTYPLYPGTIAQYFTQELCCKGVSVSTKEVEKSGDTEKSFLLCWHPTLPRKTQLFNFHLTWATLRPCFLQCLFFFQLGSLSGQLPHQRHGRCSEPWLWDALHLAVVPGDSRCAVLIHASALGPWDGQGCCAGGSGTLRTDGTPRNWIILGAPLAVFPIVPPLPNPSLSCRRLPRK